MRDSAFGLELKVGAHLRSKLCFPPDQGNEMNQNFVRYIAIFFICGMTYLNNTQAAEGDFKCEKPDLVAIDGSIQIGQNIDDVIAGLNQRKIKFAAFSKHRVRPSDDIKLQDAKTLSPIEIVIQSSREPLKWW